MTLSIDLIPQHLIQNETGTTSSEGMFEEENNMSELEFVMEELPQTSEPENDVQLIMDKSGAIGCQSQFDEFEFRQRCKTAQSEICFELKCKLYSFLVYII